MGSPANNCYAVVATGSSGSSIGGGAVTRTITATICLGGDYLIQQGGAFDATATLGSLATFTSTVPNAPAVASSSTITNDGHISGNIRRNRGLGIRHPNQWNRQPRAGGRTGPVNSIYVYDYTQSYVYQGTAFSPTLIGPTIGSASSYGPSPANPLGIYYSLGKSLR